MSSTFRFLCLSHHPAITIDAWETQTRDEAVGLAERRATADPLVAHRDCLLAVGRYSYPLVEVYNPKTRRWLDADVLRLLVAACDAGVSMEMLAPFFSRGWDMQFLDPLRVHLGFGTEETTDE